MPSTTRGKTSKERRWRPPRKYYKVCSFSSAWATAAIQLDFLCTAAVIICIIIYRPETHHTIINHITLLPVNIICECVRSGTTRRKRFRFDVMEKTGRKTIFFFLVRTTPTTNHTPRLRYTRVRGCNLIDIIHIPVILYTYSTLLNVYR